MRSVGGREGKTALASRMRSSAAITTAEGLLNGVETERLNSATQAENGAMAVGSFLDS